MNKDYCIYCICLKNEKKRLTSILNQQKIYKDLNISYGIDYRDLNKKKLLEKYPLIIDNNTFKKVTKGAICCYLSHLKLYKLFESLKKKYMIILEDDCLIKDNFYQELDQLFNDIPKDFDFIYIYYDKIFYKKKLLKYKKIKSYRKCFPMYGTVGYIINKSFLKKITHLHKKKIRLPIDDTLMKLMKNKKINYYASANTLIKNQGLGFSTNHKFNTLIHYSGHF